MVLQWLQEWEYLEGNSAQEKIRYNGSYKWTCDKWRLG